MMGYAGLPCLGPSALSGVGGYTSAMLMANHGVPFLLALPAAVLMGAVVGAGLGWLCIRVRDDYLCIVTIGSNFLFWAILVYTTIAGVSVFGSSVGIFLAPAMLNIVGFSFASPTSYMIVVWVLAGLLIFIDSRFSGSRIGLSLRCVRDSEQTAYCTGIDIVKVKVITFVVGSSYLALGGHLYVNYLLYAHPNFFDFGGSVPIILAPLFGGLGTLAGAIVGGIVVSGVPELLRMTPIYRMVIFALLLVTIPILQPRGLLGHGSYLRKKTIDPLEAYLKRRAHATLKNP